MNYSALIDWRAGARAVQPTAQAPRPTVARLRRRLRSAAFWGWMVIVHGLALVGGCCLAALFMKSCGVL